MLLLGSLQTAEAEFNDPPKDSDMSANHPNQAARTVNHCITEWHKDYKRRRRTMDARLLITSVIQSQAFELRSTVILRGL